MGSAGPESVQTPSEVYQALTEAGWRVDYLRLPQVCCPAHALPHRRLGSPWPHEHMGGITLTLPLPHGCVTKYSCMAASVICMCAQKRCRPAEACAHLDIATWSPADVHIFQNSDVSYKRLCDVRLTLADP